MPPRSRVVLAVFLALGTVACAGGPSVAPEASQSAIVSNAAASSALATATSPASSASASPALATATATTATVSSEPAAVLIGAGDVCRLSYVAQARKTAALVAARPNAMVFTLGDNSNDQGTAKQYRDCFGTTWGAFKSRIHPVAGNHDMLTSGGAPYYAFFGEAAGPAGKGYYSYDLAVNWHVVVLNGNCGAAGGCGKGSAQEKWLKADLAANSTKHVIAMWHQPEFSSGGHGSTSTYITWWRDLYAAHAEIVLDGHDHDHERFAPQSPDGTADPNGIREFVVGTGGAAHSPIVRVRSNSEVRNASTYGVLELTLRRDSYSWRFIPVAGGTFIDSGETTTHS
jgi:hypothetical protein